MKYALLALAVILWILLTYFQAKLLLRKKVAEFTGSGFRLGLCLSLAVLYVTRPRFGFWSMGVDEFELWLDSMRKELSESEALRLSRDAARRLRGETKTGMRDLIEQAEDGAPDVYDAAREVVVALVQQVRLGHDVVYSFCIGAVYCAVAVALLSFVLVRMVSR